MNNISHSRLVWVSVVIFLSFWSLPACHQPHTVLPTIPQNSILILNSDQSVDKYATIQQEFKSELDMQTTVIDFAGQPVNHHTLQNQIARLHPALIYTIGSSAYSQAAQVIQDKPLIFSSMINWRRFTLNPNTYGISLELPVEMQVFMYSYLFPDIRTLGVLYSQRHNQQWFELAVSQAEEVGLLLKGQPVDSSDEIPVALTMLLPQVDAIWLISDPIVLYNINGVQEIFTQAATNQKPIFAYDTLFSQYGAILTIAADVPTMGRQAAGLVRDILNQQTITETVQFPAGSHVTLNLKKVHEYGIKINHAALSSVGTIIQ